MFITNNLQFATIQANFMGQLHIISSFGWPSMAVFTNNTCIVLSEQSTIDIAENTVTFWLCNLRKKKHLQCVNIQNVSFEKWKYSPPKRNEWCKMIKKLFQRNFNHVQPILNYDKAKSMIWPYISFYDISEISEICWCNWKVIPIYQYWIQYWHFRHTEHPNCKMVTMVTVT